jgi:hypothetical protein
MPGVAVFATSDALAAGRKRLDRTEIRKSQGKNDKAR